MVAKSRPATKKTTAEVRPTKKARIEDSVSRKIKHRTTKTSNEEPTVSVQYKGKQKADQNIVKNLSSAVLPSTFKIVAGSYEKLLYGLEGSTSIENDEVKFHLKPIFIFPAHVSCIKAVAASPGGKWLATGSADEIVKVWDLKRKKEIGGLMHHEGSITTLLFPSRSHLVSASEDGTIGIFHARDWSVLRTLRGHKGHVNSVDVHLSGKVALSVGKDRMLRMWDMMRGRGVASVKLGKEGEIVRWSTDGEMFAVQSGKEIDIYGTDMSLLYSITHPSRLHDIKFCKRAHHDGQVLLASAEDKKVSIYDFLPLPGQPTASDSGDNKESSPKIVAELVGHGNRQVKALQTLNISLLSPPPSTLPTSSIRRHPHSTTIISTVSSDGKINVYDLGHLHEFNAGKISIQEIQPVATYDTKGTRLTCVTLGEGEIGTDNVTGKRNRDRQEVEEEDDDESAEDEEWGGVGADEDEEEEEGEEDEEEESD
ncbi:WD40-repeat-containing domain protein [Lentinula edodes]|uniref:WD40-repeat-containing domain protein n=1 Tax=Lentinula edodes TaxID=5353 RepID=UPI001E8D0510|nr:WD40-repeat-containing domain protein [Lentinula edodes]KAH7873889.1 WD40-repeat-containing domain protein [Lentinula edodes]